MQGGESGESGARGGESGERGARGVAWRHPPNGNTRRRGAGVKGEGISQHL